MILREIWSVLITSLSTVMAAFLHSVEGKQDVPPEAVSEPERNDLFPAPYHRLREVAASIRHLPRTLGNRTDQGDLLILTVFLFGFLTGYAALLIDFPLALLGVLGLLSLASLALVMSAAWYRFSPVLAVSGIPAPGGTISSRQDNHTRHAEKGPSAIGEDIALPEERTPGTLDTYWIEAPYVYIKIIRQGNQGFTYMVVEPAITPREQIVLRETTSHLRKVIVYDDPGKSPVHLLSGEFIHRIIHEFYPDITNERLAILTYYLRRDLSGFGPLEALMHDPALEDISCNGDNLPVFVFHRSWGSLPTSVLFREGELNQFVLKLAQKANKQISLTNPMVDATLPGGSRLQVTYSNVVSLRGSSFTIRKFRTEPMTPLDLIRLGTYNAEILAFLWLVIEHRRSLIIAGGTASGKTSTMNAVSLFIPQNAKIVSLEDTHEIQLPHNNWLATLTRELPAQGTVGDIDLFSLLKSSMRQRPEYIIVGEVRGKEAQTLFQAMNTGHATLSTIHAGSVQETINRLTHEPISVPPVMFTALDLVINQSIYTSGNSRIRRCHAIHELAVEGSIIIPKKLYEWDVCGDSFRKVAPCSRVLNEIAAIRGWSPEQVNWALKKREEFLTTALEVPNPDIHDLANAIHDLGD